MAARPLALCLAALLAPLAGCTVGGSRSASEENDRLRRQVHELTDRIKRLEGERDELRVKLAAESAARRDALPPAAAEALPACTSLEIDTLSGLRPADRARPAEAISICFIPRDGRGRFVQVVGSATVAAVKVPAGWSGAEPPTDAPVVAAAALTPPQVRDAYRSGLTGTYYEAVLPLRAPVLRATSGTPDSILIHIEFTDALTGQVHRADRVLSAR